MDPQRRSGWLEIAQTLAAYVAVPVALVYPFGFFALFVQFTKYFYLDFYTAWYAASLVNRMVAIGQGVTILALALGVSVLLSAKIAQILLKHAKNTRSSRLRGIFVRRRFVRRHVRGAKLTTLLLVTLILYIAYSRILAGGRVSWFVLRGRQSTECDLDQAMRHQLNLWPDSLVPASIFLAGCSLGGWLIYRSYQGYRGRVDANQRRSPSEDYRLRPGFFDRGVTEGWVRSGLALAYATSVLASIVLAAYTPAYVPYMTLKPSVEYLEGEGSTNNRFLSHTEGQWYLLHRIERDSDYDPRQWSPPEYRIVSLAEGEVEHVRVSPNPPRASRVEPLPWRLGEQPSNQAKDRCKKQNVQ
jgi:hypothetical protein